MTTRSFRSKLFSAVAVSALLASGAHAQDAGEAGQGDAEIFNVEEIVITGTRIRRDDLSSNSPQTAVKSEEFKFQGATTVESVLNRLPQFTADANENVSNGSNGTSQVNLRNLGSNRVLVLLNGRRLLPQEAVDLNFVPSALVERVDVVSGGASAVYGSDALSGVVNFILRDNLDGVRVDAQSGFAQHNNNNDAVRGLLSDKGYELAPGSVSDGSKYDINIAAGKNFADGKGNVTLYGGFRKFNPVVQSSRDVSSCALNQADAEGTALYCGGSSNSPHGTFTPLEGDYQGVTLTNNKDGSQTFVPYDSSYAYNYAPTNYFQRSDERYTAGGFAKYEFSDKAEVYGNFMYMRDHTFSQVAPSGMWLGTTFSVSCNNPLASADQLAVLCGDKAGTAQTADTLIGYRMTLAPRRDDLRHTDYRYSAGLRGDLGNGFSYDINYLYSRVKFAETYMNDVDQEKAKRAVNVVDVNGVPTCVSVIDGTDPTCIPANVFQSNGVTAEQGAYMFSESNTASRNTQKVLSASISGDLANYGMTSPWAEHGVGIALGVEHRRDTLNFTADEIAKQAGTTDTDGVITVNEAFAEVEVPLIEDAPFIQSLTLNGGLRYSSYKNRQDSTGLSSDFNVWTYKGELSWQPIDDIRFRASYNHAIRAPGIGELFAAQQVGNVAGQDPCAGANPAASAAVCALTGVSADQYGHVIECPADTCSALGGGNQALKPETANTWTLGFVLTPQAIKNFSLSADYYNIKVTDYISSVDATLVISQCVATGDPYFCGLFNRDPRTGAIFGSQGYIVSTTLNTGYLKTAGVDITADYSFDVGSLGTINTNIVGTWLSKQESAPLPGLGSYDCKGLYGYTCGQPSPEWRHVARATWMFPTDTSVSVSWRHLGGTKLSSLSDNPFLTGTPSVINAKIDSYDYIDLAVTQTLGEHVQLRAGVNNLFDLDPPAIAFGILSSFGNGNTYPGVYDPLGRTIFVNATVEF